MLKNYRIIPLFLRIKIFGARLLAVRIRDPLFRLCVLRDRPARARARRISEPYPVDIFGRSQNLTALGVLKPGSRSRQKTMNSSSVALCPGLIVSGYIIEIRKLASGGKFVLKDSHWQVGEEKQVREL